MSKARRNTRAKKPKVTNPAPAAGGGRGGFALDREALGLLLGAVGFFLAVTLLFPLVRGGALVPAAPPAPADEAAATFNLTGSLRHWLLHWLGLAAYLLPLVPLGYGALAFMERPLGRFHRAVLGGLLVAGGLMCLLAPFWPALAGQLALLAVGPLRALLGVAALLLPLLALALGLDLLLGLPPLTLLRRAGHAGSRAAVGAADRVGDKWQERREGRGLGQQRRNLRRELGRHLKELSTLQGLYPARSDLTVQIGEVSEVRRNLRKLPEEDIAHYEEALRGWDKELDDLSLWAARDLRGKVEEEALEEREQLEAAGVTAEDIRAGRHELGVGLPSTAASAALDELRRHMVVGLTRLSQRAGRLERARESALVHLNKATKPSGKQAMTRESRIRLLKKEAAAMARREEDWREVAAAWQAWRTEAPHFGGWPDLAGAYDRLPDEERALELARALKRDAAATLRDKAAWAEALAGAEQADTDPANADPANAERPAAAITDFGTEAEGVDEAAFLPAPTRKRGKAKVAAPPQPSAEPLPAFDLALSEMELGELNAAADELLAETAAPSESSGAEPAPADWQPEPPAPTPVARSADTPPWEGSRVGAAQATVTATAEPSSAEARIAEKLAAVSEHGKKPKQGALELALPGTDLLDPVPAAASNAAALDVDARKRAALIDQTLGEFNLQGRVVDFARGPTVTRYEIEPAPGEKISRIASLSNDLARALAVAGVRIEAPVPGKNVIGLEVPNARREPVTFHQAIATPAFARTKATLPIILGKSIDGEMLVGDLAKMPHMLIAGSTGSGKSVCVNTLIQSLLFRFYPQQLRFLMIDPKMVELTPYDGIPHLVRGVVTNPVDAAGVLLGAVAHMERRYKMMSQVGAKNLEQFNAKMRQIREPELPHLVIIIDELADLMVTSPKEVEAAIMRLAQMARATGMHLVLATQRPSVDILTSLIKVNVPARAAFAVSSSHDSRTILDSVGAERLTGMGDMLFYQPGLIKPVRLQGPFISEEESVRVTSLLQRMVFEDEFGEAYGSDFDGAPASEGPSVEVGNMDFSDPYLRQAAQIVVDEGQASVSRLQRRLSVGHARAGKLMDMLEAMEIVGKHQGSKPRDVLITEADLPEYFGK